MKPDPVILELTPHELFTVRDALLYYAEFASEDLCQQKIKVAGVLRSKLLGALIADMGAPVHG